MEAKAVGRYLRVPPRKARYVLDTVRGKSVDEALATLKFIPNSAARFIEEVLESAVANAVHNYSMDRETLRLSRAYVNQGPSLKRIRPRAMGRAYQILKRMSHITMVVAEDEALRKPVEKPKGRERVRAKKETAEAAASKAEERPAKKQKVARKTVEAPEAQGEAAPAPEAAEEQTGGS